MRSASRSAVLIALNHARVAGVASSAATVPALPPLERLQKQLAPRREPRSRLRNEDRGMRNLERNQLQCVSLPAVKRFGSSRENSTLEVIVNVIQQPRWPGQSLAGWHFTKYAVEEGAIQSANLNLALSAPGSCSARFPQRR